MSDEAYPPPPPPQTDDIPPQHSPPEEAPPASSEAEVASATPPLPEVASETEQPDPPAVVISREPEESVEKSGSKKKSFIQPAVSFKEESYFVSDLSESERRALNEFKDLVRESIADLAPPSPPPQQPSSSNEVQAEAEVEGENKPLQTIESTLQEEEEQTKIEIQDDAVSKVSIWGVPLLEDERTDVVLLKFLRARDFRVKESFEMLKKTLIWRKEFGIEKLIEEDLGDDLEKVVFMHGRDKDGHPVCYNVYGEFQNKELYLKTFSSQEKREKFLRWRIQFLERSIRKLLDFRPGGVNTLFQVNDLKNAPGPGKRDLRQATRQALHLLQDNYPEFVAKQVFINVPWWHVAFYTMMSPIMTQRTKSKFVFVGAAKTADTLFKYISPEHIPIPYGGLCVDMCECNPEFTFDDPATEIIIKSTTKQFVEILVSELIPLHDVWGAFLFITNLNTYRTLQQCVIQWELRVVGWEVTFSAEFVPKAKDAYTIVIQKATKMSPNDDPVISGSFKVSDLGKIVLTVDNPTFKKRRFIYRYKIMELRKVASCKNQDVLSACLSWQWNQ
ncbi:hypothetical protein V2J09_013931 [Rumex salicifolius]